MPPQDIQAALQQRPFEPFLLVMSDGRTYEVRHPEMVLLGVRSMVIGVPAPDQDAFFEQVHILALSHITRLEPVDRTQAADAREG